MIQPVAASVTVADLKHFCDMQELEAHQQLDIKGVPTNTRAFWEAQKQVIKALKCQFLGGEMAPEKPYWVEKTVPAHDPDNGAAAPDEAPAPEEVASA